MNPGPGQSCTRGPHENLGRSGRTGQTPGRERVSGHFQPPFFCSISHILRLQQLPDACKTLIRKKISTCLKCVFSPSLAPLTWLKTRYPLGKCQLKSSTRLPSSPTCSPSTWLCTNRIYLKLKLFQSTCAKTILAWG